MKRFYHCWPAAFGVQNQKGSFIRKRVRETDHVLPAIFSRIAFSGERPTVPSRRRSDAYQRYHTPHLPPGGAWITALSRNSAYTDFAAQHYHWLQLNELQQLPLLFPSGKKRPVCCAGRVLCLIAVSLHFTLIFSPHPSNWSRHNAVFSCLPVLVDTEPAFAFPGFVAAHQAEQSRSNFSLLGGRFQYPLSSPSPFDVRPGDPFLYFA